MGGWDKVFTLAKIGRRGTGKGESKVLSVACARNRRTRCPSAAFSLLDPVTTVGPTGVVRIATPDGQVTQGYFYTSANFGWVAWVVVVSDGTGQTPNALFDAIYLYENGQPVTLLQVSSQGLSWSKTFPRQNAWPTTDVVQWVVFGNMTAPLRSRVELAEMHFAAGLMMDASTVRDAYAGNATCNLGKASPPPAPARSVSTTIKTCAPIDHAFIAPNIGTDVGVSGAPFACTGAANGDGLECVAPATEMFSPPFTIHAIATPSAAGVGASGPAPLLMLTDGTTNWARATGFGVWLDADNAVDGITLSQGTLSSLRAENAWAPGQPVAVTFVVTDTTADIYTATAGFGAVLRGSAVVASGWNWPMFTIKKAYVGSAQDPAYPRGFLAPVSAVYVFNTALSAAAIANITVGQPQTDCAAPPPGTLAPPPKPRSPSPPTPPPTPPPPSPPNPPPPPPSPFPPPPTGTIKLLVPAGGVAQLSCPAGQVTNILWAGIGVGTPYFWDPRECAAEVTPFAPVTAAANVQAANITVCTTCFPISVPPLVTGRCEPVTAGPFALGLEYACSNSAGAIRTAAPPPSGFVEQLPLTIFSQSAGLLTGDPASQYVWPTDPVTAVPTQNATLTSGFQLSGAASDLTMHIVGAGGTAGGISTIVWINGVQVGTPFIVNTVPKAIQLPAMSAAGYAAVVVSAKRAACCAADGIAISVRNDSTNTSYLVSNIFNWTASAGRSFALASPPAAPMTAASAVVCSNRSRYRPVFW